VCGRAPPDDRIGQVIAGRYRLASLLGAGGMGRVYRAEHVTIGESVAVKFLLAEWAARPEFRARFKREAVALARLRHPNVVSVLDYGEHAGELYLVMELLRGFTLDTQILAGNQTLPVERAVEVIDQVLQVLEAAHAMGIVHRDLKPENVMLLDAGDRTDRVKVLDFGIAMLDESGATERITQTGTVRGTPLYMSPEQCVGRQVGPASDVYSAGVMLYEMLTGRTPFTGRSAAEIISQQMFAPAPTFAERPPPREVPLGMEALVMRALSKRHEQRPTAREFRDALHLCARGLDDSTHAARSASERARAAGLSRDERALSPEPESPRIEGAAHEVGPPPRVALWGFDEERARSLRTALAVVGTVAFEVMTPALPGVSPDKRPWKALLVPGDATALDRLKLARQDGIFGRLPVLVLDVKSAGATPEMIRAGASDVALVSLDDTAVCQKVLRALRRGR
jgi:serine/threonine-protein kinase